MSINRVFSGLEVLQLSDVARSNIAPHNPRLLVLIVEYDEYVMGLKIGGVTVIANGPMTIRGDLF